jgi:hypothetical protein
MGLYNFEPRFVPFIKAGTKCHTIRKTRRYPDRPGRRLFLYEGLRTKNSRLILKTYCTRVENISISEKHEIFIEGQKLSKSEAERLAQADGFSSFVQMMNFWDAKNELPFVGHVIHWGKP